MLMNIVLKKWVAVPLMALMLVLPGVSFAQAPSAAQLNLARQVVALQRGPELHALLGQLADHSAQTLVAKFNPLVAERVPQERQEQVYGQLNTELKNYFDDVVAVLQQYSSQAEDNELANAYAQRFTESELRAMVAWFSSDAFKKYQAAAPDLVNAYMNGLMERSYTAIQQREAAFETRINAIIDAAQ